MISSPVTPADPRRDVTVSAPLVPPFSFRHLKETTP